MQSGAAGQLPASRSVAAAAAPLAPVRVLTLSCSQKVSRCQQPVPAAWAPAPAAAAAAMGDAEEAASGCEP